MRPPPRSTLFPYTTLFRSDVSIGPNLALFNHVRKNAKGEIANQQWAIIAPVDRKSTRLNSSHANISYAVFCLKKKNEHKKQPHPHNRTTGLHGNRNQSERN